MSRRGTGAARGGGRLDDDPHWYKDAIIYELHVRAFADADGDGIGDFAGLRSRLDYLQDLGVTALWLLPFYPSPLKDDGYDTASYTDVHPSYGTLADVKAFLREAHDRGLRVITELVLNHTSDQHPWFQRARRARPGSAARNFYVWSDTPERYRGTRVIFQDFEPSNWSWDPVAGAYYWHRFYSHQPDLNFDNPEVHRALLQTVDFWLAMGVDGLRLDAVPYLYEREGTSCENLDETHAFLRQLRAHVDRSFPNRMLLAEANQWPEDAVAYFGRGDECHMAFHFPVMPRLFMGTRLEDRFPVVDILQQTPAIPDPCQWALFLRNHDELTLEMVTDEDRDYMYRVYAQDPRARINLGIRRRLAPLLGGDRRRIELLHALLFSLPGTPVLYYGDEIGMGDNIYLGDRHGVRTPMQWSGDRNAGFSRANPQRLYLPVIVDPEYHFEAVNVEAQQGNPHSLLWWIKRLIALRRRHRAFGHGSLEFVLPDNRKVLAFVRRFGDDRILVVANLSRFPQAFELDLREHAGSVAVEMFGRTPFATVSEGPLPLTLGPHGFLWLALERQRTAEVATEPPLLSAPGGWEELVLGARRPLLEEVLPPWLAGQRWFAGKARAVVGAQVVEVVPMGTPPDRVLVALVRVDHAEGEPDTYLVPLALAAGDAATEVERTAPQAIIARLAGHGGSGGPALLHDALVSRRFGRMLLDAIGRRRRFRGPGAEIAGVPTPALRELGGLARPAPEPEPVRAEQSNSSIRYGERFILKVFRRVEQGENPELELGRSLSRARFPHVAPLAGHLEWRRGPGPAATVAVLFGMVPAQADAWEVTLDALSRFFERALTIPGPAPELPPDAAAGLDGEPPEIPAAAREAMGTYLDSARLLGLRTGQMHGALAAAPGPLAAEPPPPHHGRSLHQTLHATVQQTLELLRGRLPTLGADAQAAARRLLERAPELRARARAVAQVTGAADRIRLHGDYHLGQVLFTGKDFVIVDFEGEPARPLGERRLKRSALRDVAGMLRSFDYAAAFALHDEATPVRTEDVPRLLPWARAWTRAVSARFLAGYRDGAGEASFLPRDPAATRVLLQHYLLEKALYELRYELNHRPGWVQVPLTGLLDLLDAPEMA